MEPIEIPELSGFDVPTTPDEVTRDPDFAPDDMRFAAARDLNDKKLVLISIEWKNAGDSHRSPLCRDGSWDVECVAFGPSTSSKH
jgi:hypothetical protein